MISPAFTEIKELLGIYRKLLVTFLKLNLQDKNCVVSFNRNQCLSQSGGQVNLDLSGIISEKLNKKSVFFGIIFYKV